MRCASTTNGRHEPVARRPLLSTALWFPAPLCALRPCRRPGRSCGRDDFTPDHHAMPFAMALDALDASIQPGAVTLLAGYRYFFIHGSSFAPATPKPHLPIALNVGLGLLERVGGTVILKARRPFALTRSEIVCCDPWPLAHGGYQLSSGESETEPTMSYSAQMGHRKLLPSNVSGVMSSAAAFSQTGQFICELSRQRSS